ncbi:MAG TPA: lipid II flippase MurJ [Candidatus Saccharimonadales bacterium]|nr:lipid II flippase MurJ [Candidatus Saccharimonadales bacterium]
MQETQPTKTKKRIPLTNVALLLIGAALIGQLLGFLRTKLVNGNFPAVGPDSTDAYFAAFIIPDFFFYTLAAGVLGVALIPVLADRLQKGDRKGMWEVCASLLNFLSIIMALVAMVIFVFADPLMSQLAHRLTPEQHDNAVTIMRLLALNPLLFTISGILTSVQQTMGRFFFFAIAPLFYNLSIIVSIYVFPCHQVHGVCQAGGLGLKGLGVGAFVGGILQLAVVCFGLIGTRFTWRPKITWRNADFRTVLNQLPPRSLDQGIDQIQTMVETRLASGLGQGVITYYNNAYILQTAPTLLIGTAISTAAFPRLAQRLSQGRPDLFRRDFLRILRFMIWLTIPVAIICYLGRGYLARIIFTTGAPQIALIFGFLAAAIFFRTIYTIVSRWFYAQKDTKTPLFVSMFTIAFNIVATVMLARPSAYGMAGLALSVSLASMIEVLILGVIMVTRDRALLNMPFWGGVGRIVSVGGFSMLAGYIAVKYFPLGLADRGITLGVKLGFIALATFVVHIAVSGLFGLEEARPIFAGIKRIVLMPIKGIATYYDPNK